MDRWSPRIRSVWTAMFIIQIRSSQRGTADYGMSPSRDRQAPSLDLAAEFFCLIDRGRPLRPSEVEDDGSGIVCSRLARNIPRRGRKPALQFDVPDLGFSYCVGRSLWCFQSRGFGTFASILLCAVRNAGGLGRGAVRNRGIRILIRIVVNLCMVSSLFIRLVQKRGFRKQLILRC